VETTDDPPAAAGARDPFATPQLEKRDSDGRQATEIPKEVGGFPVAEDGAIQFPADADPALVEQSVASLTKASWKVENVRGTWFIRGAEAGVNATIDVRQHSAEIAKRRSRLFQLEKVIKQATNTDGLGDVVAELIATTAERERLEAQLALVTGANESTNAPIPGDDLQLHIAADGTASLEGATVTVEELGPRLATRERPVRRVWLTADAARPFKEIVAWTDELKAAGVNMVNSTSIAAETNAMPSPAAGQATSQQAPYRLGPGDTLLVRALGVLPDQPVDGPFVVEDEGTIALGPAYGRVEVAVLSVREAEAAVLASLTETLKDVVKDPPKVQVTIAEKAPRPQVGGGVF
jgi:biopolymer transport protein ExbD